MDDFTAKAIGVGVTLLAGGALKHRSKVNHKAAGPATNQILGQVIGAVTPLTQTEGFEVAIATEAVYNSGKSLYHASRYIWSSLRKMF